MLFRGNAEADIRRALVRKGYIKGIIGLPANLFYGTGIPACIVVIDKEDAQARKGIFMIDASGGFMKDGPKNRLRAQDIHKIVDVFNKRLDVPKYARMVSFEEIEKNEFNLNLPRYIDSQTPEDLQDIAGHLQGGIPAADVDALQRYWAVCPQLRHTLFKKRPPRLRRSRRGEGGDQARHLRAPRVRHLHRRHERPFRRVAQEDARRRSKRLKAGCHPKEVIAELAEGLLAHYAGKPLIDPYDVYQHLMDYWAETMQDDCYLIAADGWKAETYRIIERRTRKGKRQEIDRAGPATSSPSPFIVARYFARSRRPSTSSPPNWRASPPASPSWRKNKAARKGRSPNSKRSTRPTSTARLKEIKDDTDAKKKRHVLNDWLKLNDKEAELKKKLKDAEAALDAKAYAHIRSSPRPRSRHSSWTTNGSPRSTPPSTARWTA